MIPSITSLKLHKNTQNEYGSWVGFQITLPTPTTIIKYYIGYERNPGESEWTDPQIGEADGYMDCGTFAHHAKGVSFTDRSATNMGGAVYIHTFPTPAVVFAEVSCDGTQASAGTDGGVYLMYDSATGASTDDGDLDDTLASQFIKDQDYTTTPEQYRYRAHNGGSTTEDALASFVGT